MHCHRTANHLSVPTSVGIGPLSFCTMSLRSTFASLKLVTVIPSQILLRIPQTRFRLSESQECCQLVLAYTTKILTSGLGPWIRNPRDTHSSCRPMTTLSSDRTGVVVRHVFINVRIMMSVTDHHLLQIEVRVSILE